VTSRVRKAVIPVAGLGTRMLPATKVVPKELVAVAGKPAVQWVVEAAVASGIEEIILVTAPGKSVVADHFAPAPALEAHLEARAKRELLDLVRASSSLARITCVVQREPLGLGHAVLMARDAVGRERFAVLLADELLHGPIPSLKQCLDVDADCVIGLARVPREDVRRYGIVSVKRRLDDRTFVLDGMVEKPSPDDAPSDLAITGNPYVLVPEVFDVLERTPRGSSGEIQLTDALKELATTTRFVGRIVEGERLDVGHALGFVQANVAKMLDDPALGPALREWLRRRVEVGADAETGDRP
jgi:UTP--glucose-1-phosphate uridylyltransferase